MPWDDAHTAPLDLVDRRGNLPLSARVGDQGWRPFQVLARFNAACLTSASVANASQTPTLSTTDQPYFEFQVEQAVRIAPGSAHPSYPAMLKSANVEGEVLAQFVVDTTGRAEMGTFRVLKSSHDGFTQAVRSVLPFMRFIPATTGGRKVRQMVQHPFTFALSR